MWIGKEREGVISPHISPSVQGCLMICHLVAAPSGTCDLLDQGREERAWKRHTGSNVPGGRNSAYQSPVQFISFRYSNGLPHCKRARRWSVLCAQEEKENKTWVNSVINYELFPWKSFIASAVRTFVSLSYWPKIHPRLILFTHSFNKYFLRTSYVPL